MGERWLSVVGTHEAKQSRAASYCVTLIQWSWAVVALSLDFECDEATWWITYLSQKHHLVFQEPSHMTMWVHHPTNWFTLLLKQDVLLQKATWISRFQQILVFSSSKQAFCKIVSWKRFSLKKLKSNFSSTKNWHQKSINCTALPDGSGRLKLCIKYFTYLQKMCHY